MDLNSWTNLFRIIKNVFNIGAHQLDKNEPGMLKDIDMIYEQMNLDKNINQIKKVV